MLSVNPASSGSSASSATDTSNITAFVSQNTIGILAAVPSAPTSVVATSGNTSLAVTWAAPASTGGSNITDYLVKYSSNNGVAGSWTRWGKTTVITATSCTVTGLTNGTAYVIKVIAKNAVGISLPSANSAPATPAATYSVANPLPPRIQWNANYGYCGEASFISAGLFYGQYLSQYDARAIASNNARQNLSSSQLLLGVNDVAAAKAMHLAATPFNTSTQTSTTSHFFTHYARTSTFSLTRSYFLCPHLLCPQPPSLPAFTNLSQLASLASGWKRVSQKKPAEKFPACARRCGIMVRRRGPRGRRRSGWS